MIKNLRLYPLNLIRIMPAKGIGFVLISPGYFLPGVFREKNNLISLNPLYVGYGVCRWKTGTKTINPE
jgi:hypothetical protein